MKDNRFGEDEDPRHDQWNPGARSSTDDVEVKFKKRSSTLFGDVHVAIYLRVSTDEQAATGDSLHTQEERARHKLDQIFGKGNYTNEVFTDPGKSGGSGPFPWEARSTGKQRRNLQRMFSCLRRGEFTHVCTLSMDRVYRDRAASTVFSRMCESAGIGVVVVLGETDNSLHGKFANGLIADFAELQRKQTAERSQLSLDKRKADGYWLGTKPYGFKHEKDGEHQTRRKNIVPVTEELEVVRRIFQMHDGGSSPPEIWSRLSAENLLGRGEGKRSLCSVSVLNILKNPAYAGLVRAKDGSLIKGLHWDYRIIEPEDHKRHLEKIAYRRTHLKGVTGPQSFRLFTGLVRCGVCGNNLEGCFSTDSPLYRCFGRERRPGSGNHVYVSARYLEAAVCSKIAELAAKPEVMKEAKAKIKTQVEAGVRETGLERDRVCKAIETLSSKRDRYLVAMGDGHISTLDFKRHSEPLDREMKHLRESLKDLEERLSSSASQELVHERALRALSEFPTLWDNLEDREKRELLRCCVENLTLHREGERLFIKLKLAMMSESEVEVMHGSARWLCEKMPGPRGLTPKQLAFLAHRQDGRKVSEVAVLMGVRVPQIYRYRQEIHRWLQVNSDEEAVSQCSAWIEHLRTILPLYGDLGHGRGSSRPQRLRSREFQILCWVGEQGQSLEEISTKWDIPLPLANKWLEQALTKAKKTDPVDALAQVRRLGLSPGKKVQQWGIRKRLKG